MAIGIILGIILLVAMIAAFAWTWYEFYENDDGKKAVISLILSIVMALSFITVPFSFHTVQSGQIAVVKHLGKITHARTAGTYFDLWMVNSYKKYDAKVQDNTIETMAYSSDAQTMTVQMTLQYQIMPDKVIDIANQYGSLEALDTRITAIAIERAKSVLSVPKAMDIIANRASMSPKVEEAIRDAIGEEYFVNVVSVVLTNIDFSDAFELAVEEKMIAEQEKLKADYENQTKVAKAQAEAEAKIIEAEAAKKANELLERSLTDKILQQEYIDKWDGKLPQVVSDGSTIFQLP